MIKIGLVSTTKIYDENNPFSDVEAFYNVYVRKIYEVGAIPVGILLNNRKLNVESLEMCDAFIIGGGNKIEPCFLELINYAIANNIPLLGICLGMQAIAIYSYLETLLIEKKKELTIGNFDEEFEIAKKNNTIFLYPIDNHYKEKVTKYNYNVNKHLVKVDVSSKLYSIFEKNSLDVISMHHYAVKKYGKSVMVNCTCDDVIEGLEYKNKDLFILGVQWHPELEIENNAIFKRLVEEAEKRKLNL